MTISVAMATYNGGKWLADQLASIARQTLLPDELIVSDDGSTDDTVNVAREFAKGAPFKVKIYLSDTRLGSRANFFRAISLCTGELIALCDQDDVWLNNKLSRITSEFRDPKILLVMHRVTVVDSQLNPLKVQPNTHWYAPGIYEALRTKPWFTAAGMAIVFRSSLFSWIDYHEANAFTMMQMGHDGWIWFIAASLGKIVAVADRLALYRQHSNNVVGSGSDERPHEAVQTSLRTGSARYAYLAEISAVRADKLRRLNPAVDRIVLQNAERGICYYEMLADFYAGRAALYRATSRSEKAAHLMALCRRKAYKQVELGGLGTYAFAKDFVLQILRGSSPGEPTEVSQPRA